MNEPQDLLSVAERHLAESDDGRRPRSLLSAVEALLSPNLTDPAGGRRSRVGYLTADRLLAFAAHHPGSDALDIALRLVETEASRCDPRQDPVSHILLLAMHGALRDERFYLHHTLDDLEGAVAELDTAARAMYRAPEHLIDPHDLAWCPHAYGRALVRRTDLVPGSDEVGAAISALERALAVAGTDARDLRAAITHTLATARVTYAERLLTQTGSPDDLDGAIDAAVHDLTRLASTADASDLDRAGYWQNIAVLLRRRAGRPGRGTTDRIDDINAGLRAIDAGLGAIPAADPGRVSLLAARADLIRADGGAAGAVEQALRAVFNAAADLGHPETLLAGANLAAQHAAAARWHDVAAVGMRSQEVAEALIRRQPRDEYRWTVVRQSSGLAAVTAHALARAGEAGAAVVALERGQVTELSDRYARPNQVLRLLAGLGHDALAADYRDAINSVRDRDQPDHVLRRAERQLNDLITRIERIPGTTSLLRTVDEEAVLAATSGQTLVYLAPGRFGGVVMIVADGVFTAHPADELTIANVAPVAAMFARDAIPAERGPRGRRRAIRDTCEWLGRFVLPLLDRHLGTQHTAVTIVLAGHLAGLPLHAASVLGLGGTRWALDQRRYTFAPSALLLHGAGTGLPRSAPALVVADPARPDTATLKYAREETAAVQACFAAVTALTQEDATGAALAAAIAGVRVVHLACHGTAVADDPMRSSLLLADGDELSLAELAAAPLDHVELAVLAGCQTAVSDRMLAGESLNLAAGLLAAGVHTVIGSLWPVPDAATARLMATFYARLADGRPPADALRDSQLAFAHGAVTNLRDREEYRDPYFWAGFVCLGQ